jgi:hypothetical protein
MRIAGAEGTGLNTRFDVELVARTIADIRALSGEAENEAFPQVARVSAVNQTLYDTFVSPVVRQVTTERGAELRRQLHPMRARRYLASDLNPLMVPFAAAAERVRVERAPAGADNPFLALERAWADGVEAAIDSWRDWRDAWQELAFHAVYGTLAAFGVAPGPQEEIADPTLHLAEVPDVRAALGRISAGGHAEAVVRMMVLLAKARGGVRRSRLSRSQALLTTAEPFASLTSAARQALIREQTIIAELAPEVAVAALPDLLPTEEERRHALEAVESVAGPEEELGEAALAMLRRLREVLGLG